MRQCCKAMVNNSLIHLRGLSARHRRPFPFPVPTEVKLAARLGISCGALANIETGRQNLLLHQKVCLAEAAAKFFLKEVTQKQATLLPRQDLLTARNRFRPNFQG